MTPFIIETNDTSLHCRQYGTKGSPIIFIHGACVDADFFTECAQILSKYYRVYTFDRRGYGRNEDTSDHRIETQAEDVFHIIQSIGEAAYIVGHSAGSLIAMALAIAHPEVISGMLIYEPVKNDILDHQHSDRIDAYKQSMIQVHEKASQGKYAKAITLFMPLMGEKDPRARAATDDELKHMFKNCFCFIKHELNNLDDYHPDYDSLADCQIPVTIGLGEGSKGSVREQMALLLKEKLHAQLLYFPGSHNAPYDLPREFSFLLEGNITY